MEIGKVPNNILKNIVLDKIVNNRSEVLVRPGIGEDCCVVDFGEYSLVMSSDPITGAVNEIGRLSVLVNWSIRLPSSSSVVPGGARIVIISPKGSTPQEATSLQEICTARRPISFAAPVMGSVDITQA
jgi:hypothetical protein